MAKLIPGKLRMEGVALYETGNIEIIKEKGNRLYTRVAGEDLRYSLEDDLVFCACDFSKKRLLCSSRSARALSEERRRRPGDFTSLRKRT